MNSDIKDRVIKILSYVMGIPNDEINEQSSPDTIEVWDSLKHMNLVLSLEEEFEVQFTEQQILEMMNVELIILTVEEALLTPKL